MADLSVVENVDEHRYELRDDEGAVLGYLEYLPREDFFVLPHTEVDRSLRGQGWGDRLVRHALDDLRTKGTKAYPTCPFVDRWIQRHDEYEDLRYQP
ncbi:GNAT family N-acetyltransferase [Glycomyces tritici]|uniref:GNAT family N-acetyltransferase n=1 Tax=Glycomyces tritici TaxID=2665176 RepID=A0ABT7YQR2_9ACTN|nr:GNAT family N-acetyltransferase [Glycomyces tritici]MDN3240973.1 GNAT family N-acetyltransferase [Glycomyces tritici]MDN3242824.1 GNAT family N-acetyltransferase [Glycomyces tritici]